MTYVPARNEVAVWWLVVYLCRCREGEVELGGKMKVKVEVFFWCSGLRLGGRETRER